jgi:hypothetical protein
MMSLLKNSFILFIGFFLISCGGTAASDTTDKPEPTKETPSTSIDPLKDPCELLSRTAIESIDGFTTSSEGRLHQASGDTYKQCNYTVDGHPVGIIFRRLSQKEIDIKKLENNYAFYLKQEAYSDVPNAQGDQALFSERETTGPSGTSAAYLLQWRYGNHTERQIEISYSTDAPSRAEILAQLLEMARKMEGESGSSGR